MVRMLSQLSVYQVVPPSVVVISHFLILSRKPFGTALGSVTVKELGLVLILIMISDQ